MARRQQPLWKCPRCGHRFVSRNLWHSCVRVRLADHFWGKAPGVRQLFDAWPSDLDPALGGLVREAYEAARQGPGKSRPAGA